MLMRMGSVRIVILVERGMAFDGKGLSELLE
jgi:hypothetical protein